uniref:Antitoxin FitA-like ribbon-helix-helix domain-containing protein n=1 Tax=Candidatus Kentrum sp. DK TaxID=2126562 RepID=A0A450SQE8_9GAMM|nr:MAG: hypothetical protein BECKDK2373C_GA0170839_105235 [Candidatus Kentron sp. DK]VFJ58462.1 MAG: hypothetical protein BECKDK2373B_GA0170837_10743 [Candidatus Kentron sp. DK]
MPQMLIRNLDQDVKASLKNQAALHGWSMENEAREILRSALVKKRPPEMGLGSRIAAHFADVGLEDDEDIPEIRGQFIAPVDFDE